jgi:competence ComEA-like helix-hairpin-helix protein
VLSPRKILFVSAFIWLAGWGWLEWGGNSNNQGISVPQYTRNKALELEKGQLQTLETDLATAVALEKTKTEEKEALPSKKNSSISLKKREVEGALKVKRDSNLLAINSADKNALQTLKGVGPVLAERIFRYRLENGSFKNGEDLQKVRGIGPLMMKKLLKYIKFD